MNLPDFPLLMLAFSLALLLLAAAAGVWLRKKVRPLKDDERDDFSTALGATLTLLGLLIGFTFSMAVSRYDLRKHYEAEEANAIGTEYVRTDLLPAADALRIRELLRKYIDQRVVFYTVRNQKQLAKINDDTAATQAELWSATREAAVARPNAVVALVLSGMNDVLNSQGYTQAAWWNRIPGAAWIFMLSIAALCNLLIAYGARHPSRALLMIVPVAVSIAFFLISDIDSPHGGVIHVAPKNLMSLQRSLSTQAGGADRH
jgi:hypothetical protein